MFPPQERRLGGSLLSPRLLLLAGRSEPAKHPVEFIAAEEQRRWPAMGAVVSFVVEIFLFQQARDFFRA